MRTNTKVESIHTFEGAKAQHISAEQQLRRSVMSCMLFEGTFYESGKSIADRICELIPKVDPLKVVNIAREARSKMNLRHVPLLIIREMASHKAYRRYVSRTLQYVIQRPDELCEFLALYWKDGKCPIAHKVKQGLSYAFQKFSEYQLSKYDRDNKVKLRDVLFMVHGKPKDKESEELYKKIVNRTLTTSDTWEVSLSGGADKKETFERLLNEKKLGALAFLRNLRNMQESKVNLELINNYSKTVDIRKVLPFRFISAAKAVPNFEPLLEEMAYRAISNSEKLPGNTIILVDVSGSMNSLISAKSEVMRIDAACGIAIIAREICENVNCFTFSEKLVGIPPRRGFALRDAIHHSQPRGNTNLGAAIQLLMNQFAHDRIIVITDEQSSDSVMQPLKDRSYMINVASYKNGIGYGRWKHIDGFSVSTLEWIREYEKSQIDINL